MVTFSKAVKLQPTEIQPTKLFRFNFEQTMNTQRSDFAAFIKITSKKQ
jgi:hypothetical protein